MPPETLVPLLGRVVRARGDADAVVSGERRTSYAELWRAIQRGASRLRRSGLSPGDRVVLLLPNSAEYIASLYAVFAAGCIAVPLDPNGQAREVAGSIQHSGARLIVSERARELDGVAVPIVTAREFLSDGSGAPGRRMPAATVDGEMAMLLYTSGSTGDPKAVMLTHENLAANTLAILDYLPLTPADRGLAALPFFYAYGNSVLHTHLLAGGALITAGMMYPQQTIETMRTAGVTGFAGVPWMFQSLLTRTTFPRMRGELPSLRYMTQAGGRMSSADIARVTHAFPDVPLFVMYGLTEATARLTYLAPGELPSRAHSVGKPIAGVRIEVRRQDGSVARSEEVGEVFASGPNIMRGYWKAPVATSRAIVSDSTGRWLRTGDLGYFDADGCLCLVGRRSEIIKTGGHRVSPLEIEEVVLQLDAIAEAAAVGMPDEQLGESIQLVVVPRGARAVTEREILAHCRRQLSAYKLPRCVRFAPTLPRTVTGKLRRHAVAESLLAEGPQ